jgi:hypothetical protein
VRLVLFRKMPAWPDASLMVEIKVIPWIIECFFAVPPPLKEITERQHRDLRKVEASKATDANAVNNLMSQPQVVVPPDAKSERSPQGTRPCGDYVDGDPKVGEGLREHEQMVLRSAFDLLAKAIRY